MEKAVQRLSQSSQGMMVTGTRLEIVAVELCRTWSLKEMVTCQSPEQHPGSPEFSTDVVASMWAVRGSCLELQQSSVRLSLK